MIWLLSLFIGRNLSHKIASERYSNVRKTLRLMGCRDDAYLWGNMFYSAAKGFVFFILNLVILAIWRGTLADEYKQFDVYVGSHFFHYFIFSLLFFICTSLVAMIIGQIFTVRGYVADTCNLIQLIFYIFGKFHEESLAKDGWIRYWSFFPQFALYADRV